MPPFTNEHISPLPLEPEGDPLPLAANDPDGGNKDPSRLVDCSAEELRARRKASLWLVKPGNGSTKAQILDHQNMLQDITEELKKRGET